MASQQEIETEPEDGRVDALEARLDAVERRLHVINTALSSAAAMYRVLRADDDEPGLRLASPVDPDGFS